SRLIVGAPVSNGDAGFLGGSAHKIIEGKTNDRALIDPFPTQSRRDRTTQYLTCCGRYGDSTQAFQASRNDFSVGTETLALGLQSYPTERRHEVCRGLVC